MQTLIVAWVLDLHTRGGIHLNGWRHGGFEPVPDKQPAERFAMMKEVFYLE